MKFSDIWTKVIAPVGSLVGDFVPYVGPAVKAINSFMPDGEKLPENATKDEMQAAVDSLPPEQKAALMEKKVELEIVKEKEWSKVVDSLAKADATGNTTRPWIAKLMAGVVAFAVVAFVIMWGVAVGGNKTEMIKAISDSWPMIVAILGTPTVLLRAYFGLRTEEKKARYAQSAGQPHISGIAGMIGSLFKK
jgi:hypothetical protein